MKKQRLMVWAAANAVGLGVAFVILMDPAAPFIHGLDLENYWEPDMPGQTLGDLMGSVVAFLAAGLVLGSAQGLVLRSHLVSIFSWVFATIAGFGLLALTVELPLQAAGILGRIPGPVEPIIATVGTCSSAGIVQYVVLRRKGIVASKWLALWVGGLVASIVPTAILFISLARLDVAVSWPVEIFLNGFVCAGVAAWISGGALFSAVSKP